MTTNPLERLGPCSARSYRPCVAGEVTPETPSPTGISEARVRTPRKEALGEELTEPRNVVLSHGGHGQGGKADEADNDAERFFRAIDRAVLEHCSRPSGLPLILAALPEHHDLFRQVSQNPFLVTNGS